jgi:hypothetical protein
MLRRMSIDAVAILLGVGLMLTVAVNLLRVDTLKRYWRDYFSSHRRY